MTLSTWGWVFFQVEDIQSSGARTTLENACCPSWLRLPEQKYHRLSGFNNSNLLLTVGRLRSLIKVWANSGSSKSAASEPVSGNRLAVSSHGPSSVSAGRCGDSSLVSFLIRTLTPWWGLHLRLILITSPKLHLQMLSHWLQHWESLRQSKKTTLLLSHM